VDVFQLLREIYFELKEFRIFFKIFKKI